MALITSACTDSGTVGSLEIELIVVPGSNPFANAKYLSMRIDDGPGHRWPINGSSTVEASFDVGADGEVHQLFVEGLDAHGVVTARGESPPVRFDEGVHARLSVVPRAVGRFSGTVGGLSAPRLAFGLAGDAQAGFTLVGGIVLENFEGSNTTKQVEHVDPYLGTIRSLPDLPVARRGPLSTRSEAGDLIVALGGVPDVHWLPADGDGWLTVPSDARPVYDAAVGRVAPDHWVIAGGFNPTGGTSDQLVELVMNANEPVMTVTGALLTGRERPTVAALGSRWVVAGGSPELLAEIVDFSSGQTPRSQPVVRPDGDSASVFSLVSVAVDDGVLLLGDAKTRILHIGLDGIARHGGELSSPRSLPGASRLEDGRILISGGEGDASTAEILAFNDGQWTPVEMVALTQPRTHHRSVMVAGGNILLIGGAGAAGLLWLGDVYTPR